MEHLIYAAYGSNLLQERLLFYIKGGEYCGRHYDGSDNKTEPESLGWIYVPYRLYFAKRSSRWGNKGIAFLSCQKEDEMNYWAVVRLWKISEQQFQDIQRQEGGWYNKILSLGAIGGFEIKTITGCYENEKQQPSDDYLNIIKAGLEETTNWDNDMIKKYLIKFL